VGYIRYVDDFVLFFDDSNKKEEYLKKTREYLARFRLHLHPQKIGFGLCCEGFEMLGHKVYPTHIRLSSKSIKRSKTRLINIRHLYHNDKLALAEAKNRIFGTVGFVKIGDNYRLTDVLLAETLLSKKSLEEVSPWR